MGSPDSGDQGLRGLRGVRGGGHGADHLRGGNRGRGDYGGPVHRQGDESSPVIDTPGLNLSSHVEAIGVKRPGHGNAGKHIEILTNHFVTSIPEQSIYHYDGAYLPPHSIHIASSLLHAAAMIHSQ